VAGTSPAPWTHPRRLCGLAHTGCATPMRVVGANAGCSTARPLSLRVRVNALAPKSQLMHQFPFGKPLLRVLQVPNPSARVFVVGVYSSAVHARWIGPDGRQLVQALAVASEPSIFWRGEGAPEIIKTIDVPSTAGRLEVPSERFNGPSGISLDQHYLAPLGLSRSDAWLCDLLPESRMNPNQAQKVLTKYAPLARRLGLPEATVPVVPSRFADGDRVEVILKEFLSSGAETFVTLGDIPLREFVAPLGIGHAKLRAYGLSHEEYGRTRAVKVAGRSFQHIPLAHPRQGQALGISSRSWGELHGVWKVHTAPLVARTLSA
jgi:hypothetical protein